MYLRSIRIANYRGIAEAEVTLEPVTLLLGENDSGKSSILEALSLILGAQEDRFEARLKAIHFHRGPTDAAGAMEIRLRFREEAAGSWHPPDALASAIRSEHSSPRAMEFVFQATLDPITNGIHPSWFIDGKGAGPTLKDDAALLDWIRRLVPVLWLRSGLIALHATAGPADPDLAAVERHYRNLITGETPDLFAELEQGVRAASAVIDRNPNLFAGTVPLLGAMAGDILNRQSSLQQAAGTPAASGAQKIGSILMLGAMLQLIGREALPESRPLLVLENPEANLHPATLASVLRLVERITWQKLISTNSGTLLTNAPLSALRRLTRHGSKVRQWFVPPSVLSRDELRRLAYHVRSRRASAMFARCWLLVEGETEFWLLPELARVLGYDFAAEGVVPVEFAQCGLRPLIKLAERLGIAWQLLTDGDDAGNHYAAEARKSDRRSGGTITQLTAQDIERCFWDNGFDDVIRRIAYPGSIPPKLSPKTTIRKAIERTSKPFLALSLIEAAGSRGPASVPAVLKSAILGCVAQAQAAPRQ